MEGSLLFSKGSTEVGCPLFFCPAKKGKKFNTGGVDQVSLVIHLDDGLAPIGGRCVRPHSRRVLG